jgi:outer membrane protein assembly factor BamB
MISGVKFTGGRNQFISGRKVNFTSIVFGSSDGRLYADGTELWRLDFGEDLTASPVYAQGRIIIAGGDGTLFVINGSKDSYDAPAPPKGVLT